MLYFYFSIITIKIYRELKRFNVNWVKLSDWWIFRRVPTLSTMQAFSSTTMQRCATCNRLIATLTSNISSKSRSMPRGWPVRMFSLRPRCVCFFCWLSQFTFNLFVAKEGRVPVIVLPRRDDMKRLREFQESDPVRKEVFEALFC